MLSHAIAPKYKSLSQQYSNVKFAECDVDKAQDVARKFGISAMPTFVFLRDGVKVDQVRGANPSALENAVRKYSDASAGTASFGGKGQS